MKNIQPIRDKIAEEITELENGWRVVAAELAISETALRKIFNPNITVRPRLSTMERIKEAVKTCQEAEQVRVDSLMA